MPIFANADEVSGPLEIDVIQCDNVPLDWLMPAKKDAQGRALPTSKGGRAEFNLTITKLNVVSDVISALSQVAHLRLSAVPMEIRNAHIVIENGVVNVDVPLSVGNKILRLSGGASIVEDRIINMELAVPKSFIGGEIAKGYSRR